MRLSATVWIKWSSISETMTVVGETPLLQTSSSELGTTVGNQQIEGTLLAHY